MGSDDAAPASGWAPPPGLAALQARCDRQAVEIDKLGAWVSSFRRGARALKDDNARLRAENDQLWRASRGSGDRRPRSELTESAIPVGPRAPRIARDVVTDCLADRVAPCVLESALLLIFSS